MAKTEAPAGTTENKAPAGKAPAGDKSKGGDTAHGGHGGGGAQADGKKGPKGHNPGPDGCHGWGCKAKAHKFNFCDEHYDHFKFGLIRKTGEPVPDYDKKIEHYQAFVAKRKSAHRVA